MAPTNETLEPVAPDALGVRAWLLQQDACMVRSVPTVTLAPSRLGLGVPFKAMGPRFVRISPFLGGLPWDKPPT